MAQRIRWKRQSIIRVPIGVGFCQGRRGWKWTEGRRKAFAGGAEGRNGALLMIATERLRYLLLLFREIDSLSKGWAGRRVVSSPSFQRLIDRLDEVDASPSTSTRWCLSRFLRPAMAMAETKDFSRQKSHGRKNITDGTLGSDIQWFIVCSPAS